MYFKIFHIILLLGVIANTSENTLNRIKSNQSTESKLEKLLIGLLSQDDSHTEEDYSVETDNQLSSYQNSHHSEEELKNINIQTLNLLLKGLRNGDKQKDKSDSDETSKKYKKCPGKCIVIKFDNRNLENEYIKTSDEDNKKQIKYFAREPDEDSNNELKENSDETAMFFNSLKRDIMAYDQHEVGKDKSGNDESNQQHNGLRCGCRPNVGRCGNELPCQNSSHQNQNPQQNKLNEINNSKPSFGKKIHINDDLDAVVVDVSDLDKLLGNEHARINERSYKVEQVKYLNALNKTFNINNNSKEKYVAVHLNNNKNTQINEIVKTERGRQDIAATPQELFKYYENKKQDVVNKVLDYIKGTNQKRFKLRFLSKVQSSKIKELKKNRGDDKLKEKIIDIIFGKMSEAKVYPHIRPFDNNIYVPAWLHAAILDAREDYSRRGMLPLTIQQKLRKPQGKIKQFKPNIFRRNNQDVQKYGVPFELDVQGLGQVNS